VPLVHEERCKVERAPAPAERGGFPAEPDIVDHRLRVMREESEMFRINRALRLLTAVTRAARRATDEARLLKEVCDIVINVGGYRFAWIGKATSEADRRVRPLAKAGDDGGHLDRVVTTWDESATGRGPTGTAIRTAQPFVVRDTAQDPRFAPWRQPALAMGFLSAAAFPLAVAGKIEGAMTLYSPTTDAFGDAEVALLADLADDVAYAIYALRASASRHEAEAALRRSEASLARAQQIANVGSWEWDLASHGMVWSDQTYKLFGLEPAAIEPSLETLLSFACEADRPKLRIHFEQLRLGDVVAVGANFRVVWKDGSVRNMQLQAEVEFHDMGPYRVVGVLQDISERVRFEDQLEQLATHDALTALPNRHLLQDRLEQGLAHARHGRRMLAVVFVDLDRFKLVNDTLGHDAGDQLLRVIAARLCGCLREGDTVARQGGDEFVVVLTDLARPEDASLVAQKMLEALAPPVTIAGQEVVPGASIGIALYPRDGETIPMLLMNADKAMYSAKQCGRNQYRFYNNEMNQAAADWLEVGANLHRALERNEFVLFYQPKVDFASGAVTGETGNALRFTTSNSTRAEGAPDPLSEIAWAQTTLGGGFLISNSLDEDINATISVEWSWTMDLSAGGSAVDLGLGQVYMELLMNGVSLNVPVDTLLTAPANGVYSDSGVFSTILNIPTQGSREVSLGVFTLSLAQASVSEVPEPSTPYLFLAAAGLLVGAMARRRGRCSPQADSLKAKDSS